MQVFLEYLELRVLKNPNIISLSNFIVKSSCTICVTDMDDVSHHAVL